MRRGGRRAEPVEVKEARGTWRPDRDAHKGPTLVVNNNGPVMPPHMQDDNALAIIARSIWEELHPQVTALGIGECDSALFARYCFLEADARSLMANGVLPTMTKMTQLRQMEELLRIAGPKSRISTKPNDNSRNPFSRNGKRA